MANKKAMACLRLGTITTGTYTRLKNILEHGLDSVPLQQGDTSQLPIAKWYDYIKEPTLADAIMDRLTANARRIELKGQSLRRKSK